jgi:twitching motility protein PilT
MPKNIIHQYFEKVIEKKASDLYLISRQRPVYRVDGELIDLAPDVLEHKSLTSSLREIISESDMNLWKNKRDIDLAYSHLGYRFRINLHWQQGEIALAARLIPNEIPSPEDLGFSDIFYELTSLTSGLVLVAGPSGSGKSTTLAAMINVINEQSRRHVITLEDPIEFVYPQKNSIIEQREVDFDTLSFYNGLKYGLRQDPDVIMVGEMRDRETMSAGLTAAETGHLVLSTLHTKSAADTISRIVDIFEFEKQPQILVQLSSVLKGVICQELLPRADCGRVAVREIMLMNHAIANLIRQNKIEQIASVIQTSRREGMIAKEMHLKELYGEGKISEEIYRMKVKKNNIL